MSIEDKARTLREVRELAKISELANQGRIFREISPEYQQTVFDRGVMQNIPTNALRLAAILGAFDAENNFNPQVIVRRKQATKN